VSVSSRSDSVTNTETCIIFAVYFETSPKVITSE